jgi:hypothetical protein
LTIVSAAAGDIPVRKIMSNARQRMFTLDASLNAQTGLRQLPSSNPPREAFRP